LGTYDLLGQAVGFEDARRAGVTVNAGATVTVNISLQIAGASTAIDVSAATAITDPSRTDLGSTLDSNATQNLPLVSRNPYNFILFQPNVSGRANTEFGVPRRVNANGFNGRINYQLDGSNNTESDRAGIRLIPISNSYVQEVHQSLETRWVRCSTPLRNRAATTITGRRPTSFDAHHSARAPNSFPATIQPRT